MKPAPVSLSVGPFLLDGGAMFSVVPRTFWEKLYKVEKDNRIVLGLNPVLIQDEERIILVDAGTPESGKKLLNKTFRLLQLPILYLPTFTTTIAAELSQFLRMVLLFHFSPMQPFMWHVKNCKML